MKKLWVMKQTGCYILMLAVGAGILAGCGSSSVSADETTETGSEMSSAVGSETADASESGDVTVVKVGTGQAWAPYCYTDDDGNLTGYDVDVLKEVDSRLEDYEFDIEGLDFSTCIVSIDSGELDMVSYQLVKSEERMEKYIFPDTSYCYSPLALCVKTDSGITDLADMAGKKMYSDPSTYEYSMLTEYNEKNPGQEINLVAVSDMAQSDEYKGVSNGTVDASLTYETAFDTVVPEIGVTNLELTDAVLVEQSYYMINKDETDFRDAVEVALEDMMSDGTLSEISTKWFGEDYFAKYKDLINNDVND